MSDNLFSPFLEPVKNSFKKFTKKHPVLTKWISWTIFGVIILIAAYSVNKELRIISFSEKTNEEITIEWLEENFTDTTYNVLLLPFNDYQESSVKKIKIERALEQRLDGLRNKYFFKSTVKSSIKIKCYLEIPEFLSLDSIRAIGNGVKADVVIYGDIYDLYEKPSKRTNIKYIVLHKTKRGFPFKEMGETGLIEFNSLDEIREGYLIKDIDYLTMWVFCNEELYYNNLDNAAIIWNSIEASFSESVFKKSNAYLCGLIGEDYLKTQNMEQTKYFLKRSTNYYEYAEILSLLGLVYDELNEFDSSKVVQLKAYELKPYSVMVNVNLGNLFTDIGDYELAIYHYKKAIEINPRSGTSTFNLGLLFGKYLNIPDSAKLYFLRALNILPDSTYAIYTSIGNSYSKFNFDTSKFYFKKALRSNSKKSIIYYDLGLLFNDYNKFDSAKYYYLIAVQINPRNASAQNNLGLLYKNQFGNPDSAFRHLQEALKIDPNNSMYNYNVGLMYEQHFNKIDSALILYNKAIQLNPIYDKVYFQIGKLYGTEYNNIDSARFYYEKAIKINSKYAAAYNNLAILMHHNFNDYELAEKYYLKTISIDPKFGEAYINYSYFLATKLNNKSKAKEYYKKAVSLDEKFRDERFEEYINKTN